MLLLSLGLLVVTFLQIPPPLPAPVPAPNIINVVVQAPPPDPEVVAESSVQSSQAILGSIIAPPLIEWDNALLNLPDFWRTTPPSITYDHSEIRGLANTLRLASGGLLAVMLFVLGMTRTLGEHVSWGRFLFAATLSQFEILMWQLGIDLNNAICAGLGAPDLPGLIRPHLDFTISPGQQVGVVVLAIVYAIVALMLLFSLLFRIGLIQVLIAIGPFALACYATPQTQGLANLYTRLAVGLVFSQVMIVLGLRLVGVLSGVGTGIAGTLLGIIMLLILRRLPGLLTQTGQGGISGGHLLGRMVMRRVGLR